MEHDFIIIGTGIAGLSAALKAAEHGEVLILTKQDSENSNTAWAQGGIACVVSDADSFQMHIDDTLDAGAGLCDEAVVRTIIEDGPERIRELIEYGVEFDHRGDFQQDDATAHDDEFDPEVLDLGREGGHSRRRILHHRDSTGREIVERLVAAVEAHPRIQVLENHFAIDQCGGLAV